MNTEEAAALANAMSRECIAFRVRLLNRVITKLYDHNLQELGITANQGTMLIVLARRPQMSRKELGRIMQMEKSTVSRNLDRMLDQGWLKELPHPNGTLRPLALTDAGRTMLGRVYRQWQISQEQARNLLGADNFAQIKTLTDRLSGSGQ
ncbi:MAG: MarR family winged helix-turn-helix transcriptional regulator [Victivallales bacterium]|nr:MarR family winged helix-turn-helix transcriptional regulator [Victivallales bacterium]